MRGRAAGSTAAEVVLEMLDLMEEGDSAVLGVRAHGTLTSDDYRRVLAPRLESMVERCGTARVLVLMDETFRGWDLGGAWANTSLDFRHRADLERVAIVGAPVWEEWCARLAGRLIAGEVRTFPADRLQDAWNWLRS